VFLLCLIILTLFIIFPFAIGVAAGIVGFVFRIPSFKEADGDAELYAKVRMQLILVAMVAIIAAIVISFVQSVWNSQERS
jgi:hypothetical protein